MRAKSSRSLLDNQDGPQHSQEQGALMSVKMALAKLCACTCGGAIIGGGAVHVAANPPARPAIVKQAKAKQATQVVRARTTYKRAKRVTRIARTECKVTPGTTVTTRTVTAAPGVQPASSRLAANAPDVPKVAAESTASASPARPATRCSTTTPVRRLQSYTPYDARAAGVRSQVALRP